MYLFICLCLFFSIVGAEDYPEDPHAYILETVPFEDKYQLDCPKWQAVDGLILEYQERGNLTREFTFKFYCRPMGNLENHEYVEEGSEKCRNGRWHDMFGELPYEDKRRNCYCNEYLKGIHGKFKVKRDWFNPKHIEKTRLIRFRCCENKGAVFVSPIKCDFVGPKELYRAGGIKFLTYNEYEQEGPVNVITGLLTADKQVMVRFCLYYVLEVHPEASYIKKKVKKNKCSFFYMRKLKPTIKFADCRFTLKFPRKFTSTNQNVLWVTRIRGGLENLMFKKQYTICKDGQFIKSIYKYPRVDKKTGIKDYIFLTKCHDLEKQQCMCFYNDTCTEDFAWWECGNKTADNGGEAKCKTIITGIEWVWDEDLQQRKIDRYFCCFSHVMKHVECNRTKWLGDKDVALILPSPRFKKFKGGLAAGLAKSMRNMDIKWDGPNMLVRYEICRMNSSSTPCPEFPCFEFDGPTPTPTTVTGSTTTSTTTTATSTIATTTTSTIATTTTTVDCRQTETAETAWLDQYRTTDVVLVYTIGTAACIAGTCETTCIAELTPSYSDQPAYTHKGQCETYITGCDPKCVCIQEKSCSGKNKFDFMYLLDESGSVKLPNYEKTKNFLVDFNAQFTISQTDTRAGLIKFSSESRFQWDLEAYDSVTPLDAAISALSYAEGGTHIVAALNDALPIFQTQGRAGIPQIALLLTDGVHNRGGDLQTSADALRAAGVTVVAVGIGPGVNPEQLLVIGGESQNVYLVKSFDDLKADILGLVENICLSATTG